MVLGLGNKGKPMHPEMVKKMKSDLMELGFTQDEDVVDKVIATLTNSGIRKDSLFFGFRNYEGPIVLFIQDDGVIKVLEKAKPGLLEIKVDDEPQRYVLDPTKLHNFPCGS